MHGASGSVLLCASASLRLRVNNWFAGKSLSVCASGCAHLLQYTQRIFVALGGQGQVALLFGQVSQLLE